MLKGRHQGYVYLQTDTDRLWFDEGQRRGWSIPAAAPRWARLWGVRHARCGWSLLVDMIDEARWEQFGLYPSGYNDWRRYAVLRGWS